MSVRSRWAPLRALALACVPLLCATAAMSGCASSFRPSNHLVAGPRGAIAAVALPGHRVAILAGSPMSKGIFIVDLTTGALHRSFSVTKEATGIAAEGGDGPLLISVGAVNNRGRAVGAVERWTMDGQKLRVAPMPAEALGISRVVQGVAYVLVGHGAARTAVPLYLPSMHVGPALPLDANAKSIQQCLIGSTPYLLYSGSAPNGGTPIVVRQVETGMVVRSSVSGESPTCLQGRQQVFALQRTFAAGSIVVLGIPTLLQQGLVPASSD
ncbi:MAG: hypothetical protein JO060_10520, partial [Candidatus Eremiobacteraeota bacterium]|nr:hypothetical protein [Candidatus Eremiobacteraeota bacterium]